MRDLRQGAVRRVKEGTSSVLVQSGLHAGGQKPWSVIAISEMCNSHWQMALYERRFNSPFEGPNIPFEAEVNIYQISSKDQGGVHQFGTKVLSWNVHWIRLEHGREELDW